MFLLRSEDSRCLVMKKALVLEGAEQLTRLFQKFLTVCF